MTLRDSERAWLDADPELGMRLESLLADMVNIDSYHADLPACRRVAERIGEELAQLGFATAIQAAGSRGVPALRATRGPEGAPRVVLLGHTDTVHPPSEGFRGYAAIPDDPARATGPGAADMKGGIAVIWGALALLEAAGLLDRMRVEVLLVGDEELGSPDSEDLIREVARGAEFCLCYEAGRPQPQGGGTVVTRRRGCGQIDLRAEGIAAHAGVDPALGASAVLELAEKVADLSALSDSAREISVTVGQLAGGSSPNTVPAYAHMSVDYRFPDAAAQEELEARIDQILERRCVLDASGKPRVQVQRVGHSRRAALECDEAAQALADAIVAAGADLAQVVVPEKRGGSSDAALTPEVGCPAVCGMGVVGDRFHTHDEWIFRASLLERARLTALVLARRMA